MRAVGDKRPVEPLPHLLVGPGSRRREETGERQRDDGRREPPARRGPRCGDGGGHRIACGAAEAGGVAAGGGRRGERDLRVARRGRGISFISRRGARGESGRGEGDRLARWSRRPIARARGGGKRRERRPRRGAA